MATATRKPHENIKLLTSLCSRNVAVEVQFEDPVSRAVSIGRTRLLALRDDGLVTDGIRMRVGDQPIAPGSDVTMCLSFDGNQYEFCTSQIAAGESMALNEWQEVEVDVWLLPDTIETVQRRSNFRVELRGDGLETVAVDLAASSPFPASRIDGRLGRARIMNLSSTGMALICDEVDCKRLQPDQRLFVTLDLPGLDEPMCMCLSVRHVSSLRKTDRRLVGGAFEAWRGKEFRRKQQTLTRVLAGIERSKLRKAK